MCHTRDNAVKAHAEYIHQSPREGGKPSSPTLLSASRLLLLLSLLSLLFLVLVFPLSLHNSGCNAVKIPLAVLANPTTPIVGLLKDTNLLERLADLALDRCRAVGVVRGTVAATVTATVELRQSADADILSEVDVSCNRG